MVSSRGRKFNFLQRCGPWENTHALVDGHIAVHIQANTKCFFFNHMKLGGEGGWGHRRGFREEGKGGRFN